MLNYGVWNAYIFSIVIVAIVLYFFGFGVTGIDKRLQATGFGAAFDWWETQRWARENAKGR
jgi:hypothetical protein